LITYGDSELVDGRATSVVVSMAECLIESTVWPLDRCS